MPVPGYAGHIRGHRGDGWKSFGTTHWKNAGKVTGNKPAASTGWDNRDGTGRPFGGWTPKDGGVQVMSFCSSRHTPTATLASRIHVFGCITPTTAHISFRCLLLSLTPPTIPCVAQTIDPDYEQHRKEAEEANEVLQLRSMGIRAALDKTRYVPRAEPGLSWG